MATGGPITTPLALDRYVQCSPDMLKLSNAVLALVTAFSIGACTQTICQDGEGGNCDEVAGSDAGGGGADIDCDDPNLTSCDSQCVDTDVSPDYCGSCDNTCSEGQGCSAGSCTDLCEIGLVNCGGECIDPDTNADFCGAAGTCSGVNAGTDCGDDQCSTGTCVSQRYLGSLEGTTGLWNYGGTIGLPGAITACQTLYNEPTADVCSFADLLDAQANGELVDATDNNAVAVTEWWILDATQNVARQCTNTDVAAGGANVPWSYQTAHIGQGTRFVSLTAGSGAVSQVVDAPSTGGNACDVARNVPCCLP